MTYSSIFNDVIGPVMRGPSSSHSAAACRIGLLARDLIAGKIENVVIDYDPNGSLVTTHESQGTDMGLYSGLLGWNPDDEKMKDFRQGIKEAGINIKVNYTSYGAKHPNTYKIKISNSQISHTMTAISTGGGAVEITEINGAEVSISGDYYELIVYYDNFENVKSSISSSINFDFLEYKKGAKNFIEIKSHVQFSSSDIEKVKAVPGVKNVSYLKPVLPVLSRKNVKVPFLYCSEMMEYSKQKKINIWQAAVDYESYRGEITEKEVFEKMRKIVHVMGQSIKIGLKGTYYEDRILQCQSAGFKEKMDKKALLNGGMLNTIVLYVTAVMEVKSSMGVIVAAPTAGSCGTIPGSILGAAHLMNKDEDEIVKAMLAAGIMGVFISEHSTFSAELGGCQAECGAASSMAAAGLVYLAGGTFKQSTAAASMALQNSLGMICDPVANRVEVPCLGKNVMAASNAVSCANMALANFDQVVPFDEVVDTMFDVGMSLPRELRCTALGGLSVTPTAKALEKRLQKFKSC